MVTSLDSVSLCDSCGSDLPSATPGRGRKRRFCSRKCSIAFHNRARRPALVERACPVCEKTFMPTSGRQKNCSTACRFEVSARTRRAKSPGYHRDYYLQNAYGLTEAQYLKMVDAQQGRCAICEKTPNKLFVDHDHATGAIRQLLCLHCNSALGQIFDEPRLALELATYLIRHGGQ